MKTVQEIATLRTIKGARISNLAARVLLDRVMPKILAAISLSLILSAPAFAQEMMGIANSNYAGTNGVALNPASMADSKTWLDVNIVGLDFYFNNNFAYLSKEDFYFWDDVLDPSNFPDVRRRDDMKFRRGLIQSRAMGPSFTLSLGRHALGFHTAGRLFVGVEKMPQPVAVSIFEGLNYQPQMGIEYEHETFRVNAMGWAEFGLSYATVVHAFSKDLWTAGVTANYNVGIANVSLRPDAMNYLMEGNDTLRINEFTGEMAVQAPAFNSGSGFGFDIGVQYKRMLGNVNRYTPFDPKSGCKHIDYRWKLGVSLVDLGYINYKQGSFRNYEAASTYWPDINEFSPDGIESIDQELASQFLFDSTGGATITPDATIFRAGLPSAASLQFDYNFGHGLYTNLTYMQGFRMSQSNTGLRKSLINITPRWEHKFFEAALPISLHDFYQPQVGLMLRLYSFVIGSDHIIPFLIPSDVQGMDIYFNLKVTLFKNPKCNKRKGRKKKKGKSCPAYKDGPAKPKKRKQTRSGFRTKKLKDDY